MKKNYFMLAAATMMFAACAETDLVNEISVESTNAQHAIGFETFAQKATRATENSGEDYKENDLSNHHASFNVWASKEFSTEYVNVYNAGVVNFANQKWTATPLKYWDKTATSYEFYAAAPAFTNEDNYKWVWTPITKTITKEDENDVTTITGGYLTFSDYVLTGADKDNLASAGADKDSWKDLVKTTNGVTTNPNDIDLMIAAPCKVTTYDNSVNLDFIHILSRLNIQVKATTTATTKDEVTTYSPSIVLTGLDVVGLKKKGSFTEVKITTTEDKEAGTKTTTIEDFENLSAGTNARWSAGEDTYTLSAYLGDGDDATLQLTTTAAYTHKFLIIPQTVTGTTTYANKATAPGNEAYLKINYTVDNEEYEAYYSLTTAFGVGSLAFNEGWQNTLTITISPQTITFSGDVAAWDDSTPTTGGTPEIK